VGLLAGTGEQEDYEMNNPLVIYHADCTDDVTNALHAYRQGHRATSNSPSKPSVPSKQSDQGKVMDTNSIAADHLDLLQSRQNDGRGVSCVRQLVAYLRRGDRQSAMAIANNEWDKIASYPEIADNLKAMGLVRPDAYVNRY
jgi:hypothetical protein